MIEFFQTNGVPLLVVLFMLIVIGVGLRGREGSCGMAMHQQMQQPPANSGRGPQLNQSQRDPVGTGSASSPAAPSDAEHSKGSPSQQTQSTRRTNQ